MADFIRKSLVKAEVKKVGKGMRCPDDSIEGLDKVVKMKIEKAVARAKADGRKTVRPHDF
ncbi:MAG: hypothetical protein M1433_02730 [Candidatus Parvarchaeota archaeon]|nr:hypothetical protein [Candidatus Parvarchaeota archaeon]